LLHLLPQLAKLHGRRVEMHGEVVDRLTILGQCILELLEEVLCLGLFESPYFGFG
jgi:hypothetical protein